MAVAYRLLFRLFLVIGLYIAFLLLGGNFGDSRSAFSQERRQYTSGEIKIPEKQYIQGRDLSFFAEQAAFLHFVPELIEFVYKSGGSGELSGKGVIVGVWDGGLVQASHLDFMGGRVQIKDPKHKSPLPLKLNNHATHVAGTIAGTGARLSTAKGIAPGATIWSFDSSDDIDEMKALALSGKTVNVSNHSYGISAGWNLCSDTHPRLGQKDKIYWSWNGLETDAEDPWFGKYLKESADLDHIALDNPEWTQVVAAGNTRDPVLDPHTAHIELPGHRDYPWTANLDLSFNGEHYPGGCEGARQSVKHKSNRAKNGGFGSIPGGNSVAKNIISVGAMVDPDVPVDPRTGNRLPIPVDEIKTTIFSSWGPTDDGRIKPDVIANGEAVVATAIPKKCTYAPGCIPSASITFDNDNYVQMGGTSMAAPVVSGILALLNEFSMSLRNKKPLRSDEAKALLIHTAQSPHQGPNYKIGWGSVHALEAGILLKSEKPGVHFQMISVESSNCKAYNLERVSDRPGRITIVWHDEPTAPVSGLNNDKITLVNDIDMMLVPPSGDAKKAVWPWTLDHRQPDLPAKRGRNIRDNVERIDLPTEAAEEGVWTLKIRGAAWKSRASVDAALAIWGFRVGGEATCSPF